MTALGPGSLVRVHLGAPHYAGLTGEIVTDACRNGCDGYWLTPAGTGDLVIGDLVWVPAAALDPVQAGES